jgi:hydroxyacylglutathione hydrolase
MFVEPFVDEGLGNSAYLVGSHASKRAALIDPLRDVDQYVALAERLGVTITHVLDTHLHADFISGARELAAQIGAQIGASAEAQLGFDHQPLREGDRISLGDLTLEVIATAGHSPEHVSYTAIEEKAQAPSALFSGGALIVGGAARTDLLGHEHAGALARQLYHTIHHKLMALPDAVNVYPTHGAGSFCAAPGSSERTTTIRQERLDNRLVRVKSEEDFVQLAMYGLPSYPVYYREMRAINQRGPKVLGGVPVLKAMAPEEVQQLLAQGVALLDVRHRRAFAEGHIAGAYGIPLGAPLITWAGWLIPFGAPLILLAKDSEERIEAVRRLIRIGYDDLRGYLEGGIDAWSRAALPIEQVRSIDVVELHERKAAGEAPLLLDVRQDSEWQVGHIPGARHIENGRLPWDDLGLPRDQPILLHCQHGDRASAAWSILARRGYRDVTLLKGGFAAWEKAGYAIESE